MDQQQPVADRANHFLSTLQGPPGRQSNGVFRRGREFRWKTPRPEWVVRNDELASLAVPTYFLIGDTDAYGGREVVDNAAREIPDARVESISGGHLPYLEQPDECARLVSEFLAEA